MHPSWGKWVRLRSYFPCIENVDVYCRFLPSFFERKHTIHWCLNDDFQFQCSNRELLFDQKYKWHIFPVLFVFLLLQLIYFQRINHGKSSKMSKFLQATNLTRSDSTATSVFQNCPVIHCEFVNQQTASVV